ncbi:MAG TPA: UDP-N-acetylmuramate--L-alanine ligase [Bdellovibrionota bacterium]|nr:UDP-N-acetylmuramate--L-alanine ligase [Bdellovibrionota bacterium]
MFKKIKKIHFVGIGGIGMSGIAEVLLNLGYQVSGSDLQDSVITQRLKKLGATIYMGHKAENLKNVQVVVTSTAVAGDNPEVIKAHELKIPVIPRAEMLAELMRMKYGIAISGTHGKTTTTSLIATVFVHAGLDPTAVVGGRVKGMGSNAKLGKSDFLVAEADESDKSFLKLSPTICVVTNIELEHTDHYKDLQEIINCFVEFLNKVPFYGVVIACVDDKNVKSILPRLKRKYVSYGIDSLADYSAKNIKFDGFTTSFDCFYQGGGLGQVTYHLGGKHNVLNVLATIATSRECGITFKKITGALKKFAGVERRLQIKGEKNGVLVIDDYGHHPTEIKATLQTCKKSLPGRRIITIFQPHRYTRTRDLYHEFLSAFHDTDKLYMVDIYAASEKPIAGVSSRKLVEDLNKNGKDVLYVKDLQKLKNTLKAEVKKNDVVLTLGAGNIYKFGEEFLDAL